MRRTTLLTRSLSYHWRSGLGVLFASLVGVAVLVGALVVGDSVRGTLRDYALMRLGRTQLALRSPNRPFRERLAFEIEKDLGAIAVPVLQLRGTLSLPDGTTSVHNVQVFGVDDRLGLMNDAVFPVENLEGDKILVNERLAGRLSIRYGEPLVIRVEKPGGLSRELALSTDKDTSIALRVKLSGIVSDSQMGRLSLEADQVSPLNLFVSLRWLQVRTELIDFANLLLLSAKPPGSVSVQQANDSLKRNLALKDVSLELRNLPERSVAEIRSGDLFIPPNVADLAHSVFPESFGVSTYFVNEIRCGDKSAPYSMISALDAHQIGNSPKLPSIESDEDILFNDWLAEDLNAKPGDTIEIKFLALGPMRTIEEKVKQFVLRAVVPFAGEAADADLMPSFPGLANVDNCKDWEPGFRIDLNNIRPKDEEYWNAHKGTPKAFIKMDAARSLWTNRFGLLTAIRIPLNGRSIAELESSLLSAIEPSKMGLGFRDVRTQALAASAKGTDFGPLLIGLNFIVIVSALLLMGMVYVFGVEQRAEEVGTLLAVGFTPRRIRWLFLMEGFFVVIIGAFLGVLVGILYARGILWALSSLWSGATGGVRISLHVNPGACLIGFFSGVLLASLTIAFVLRKYASVPASRLLSSGNSIMTDQPKKTTKKPLVLGGICGVGSTALLAYALLNQSSGEEMAGLSLGAGFLALLALLCLCYFWLVSPSRRTLTIGVLGARGVSRRPGRSMTTVALAALGTFLVIGVGANRQDPFADAERRESGTGGFSFHGIFSVNVYDDLNTKEGLEKYGLSQKDLFGASFVPLRVLEGDDASCLNLNRAQVPRLLGVDADSLNDRKSFSFSTTIERSGGGKPWLLLERDYGPDVVPAVGDQSTVLWGLGKSVGDTLKFSDEKGGSFSVLIVGVLSNSVLQGSLIISESQFMKRFPSQAGYRQILIDAPYDKRNDVKQKLETAFRDAGLELVSASERLAGFVVVENTYLSIFQAVGALGLLIGTVGLGVVVLRNVMERRGELALLQAVGFSPRTLQRLVITEHGLLLLFGVFFCGAIPALIAACPALILNRGISSPSEALFILIAILVNGLFWTWLATVFALRGSLLDALRSE